MKCCKFRTVSQGLRVKCCKFRTVSQRLGVKYRDPRSAPDTVKPGVAIEPQSVALSRLPTHTRSTGTRCARDSVNPWCGHRARYPPTRAPPDLATFARTCAPCSDHTALNRGSMTGTRTKARPLLGHTAFCRPDSDRDTDAWPLLGLVRLGYKKTCMLDQTLTHGYITWIDQTLTHGFWATIAFAPPSGYGGHVRLVVGYKRRPMC